MTFDTRTMMPMKPVLSATGLGDDAMNMEFETIKTPLSSDILCGKNKICIKHEGSKNFRRIIESYTLRYQQASSRNEKMEVTKEIFDKLQTCRFLKYNEETEMWETLHPLAVRDKIGHALRFSNRKGSSAIRKQVRRSTSDMATLKQADLSSLRATSSMSQMTCMDSLPKSRQNPLRHSTGNLPFPDLLQQSADFGVLSQQLQMVNNFALGGSMHNFNGAFPSTGRATNQTQAPMPGDLSWMLQMPLIEMERQQSVGYISNGQHPQASV